MKLITALALATILTGAAVAQAPTLTKKAEPKGHSQANSQANSKADSKTDPKMPFTTAPEATAATIMQLERDASKAMQQRGVDGWMEFVAENAVEGSGSSHPSAVGRDAIRASMAEETKGGKLTWVPIHAEVFKGAKLAYAVGRYTFASDDPKVPAAYGTYLTMWEKQKDRSWKVVFDTGSPEPVVKK